MLVEINWNKENKPLMEKEERSKNFWDRISKDLVSPKKV